MTFKEYISESEITKDSLIAYDITHPTKIYRIGTGFQGKVPFKNNVEAKSSFGSDHEDIAVMKISDFEKKFKIKVI
jgi:hypothetical protein